MARESSNVARSPRKGAAFAAVHALRRILLTALACMAASAQAQHGDGESPTERFEKAAAAVIAERARVVWRLHHRRVHSTVVR